MPSTTVTFNLKTAGFDVYANQTLSFKLLQVGADKSPTATVILPGIVTATSAADGTGSASLFTTGSSDIESTFEVIFPNREKGLFQIPATSAGGSIDLSDLLVDHVPGGSAAPQNSVYDAAVAFSIQRANHTGNLTLDSLPNGSITGTLAVANGGTDASTPSAARTSLGLGTIATQASNSVDIDGGAIDGAVIGANAAAAGTFSSLTSSSANITTLTASTANLTDATDKRLMTDAQETKLDAIDSVASSNFVPRSITFTDTSAFLSLADNAALDVDAGDFSLSFWARLDANDAQPVLQKNGTAGYGVFFDAGILKLILNTSGSSTFNLATGLADSKWHCYVVTVDRDGNAVAYVDNVAQTGVDVSSKAGDLSNASDFLIGKVGSDAGDGIALGNYIALHKAVLTASQAAQIFFSADAALTAVAPTLMVDLRKATNTFTDVGTNGLPVTTNGTIIFNESRIVQQSTTGTTTGTTGGSGTALHINATITGGVGSTAYTVGDIVKALKAQGLLAQ
jgi:hypothetical protein